MLHLFFSSQYFPLHVQESFQWTDDASPAIVKQIWNRKASLKYRDWIHSMKESGKKHPNLPQEIYEQFLAYWELPEVKAQAEKAANSRAQNQKRHCGGSRSFADYRNDLV